LLSEISRGLRPDQTNQLFDRRDTPIIISWIFAAHQIEALATFGAEARVKVHGMSRANASGAG
jgi:hypothetical protein